MAVLTRAQQRTLLNYLIGDATSTNPEMTDTRKNALLDEWHSWVWEAFGPRLLQIDTSDSLVTDSGLALTSGFSMLTERTDYADLLSVHYEADDSAGNGGSPLDRISLAELMRRRAKSTTAGTPTAACWYREQSVTGSPVGSASGAWRILVHAPVGAIEKYFSILVRRDVIAYTGDSSTPDVTPMESRLIARGAAVEACYRIGRGPRAKRIARRLPDMMKAALALKLGVPPVREAA